MGWITTEIVDSTSEYLRKSFFSVPSASFLVIIIIYRHQLQRFSPPLVYLMNTTPLLSIPLRKVLCGMLVLAFFATHSLSIAQPTKPPRTMTFEDMMKFRSIELVTLSANGAWLGYVERPDRGDPVVRIQSLQNNTLGKQTYAVERGSRINFTRDGAWSAVTIAPKYLVAEKAKPDNRPDNGLCVVQTSTGKQTVFENVQRFVISENGKWLAVHFTKNRKEPKDSTKAAKDTSKTAAVAPKDTTTKKTAAKPTPPKDKKPDAGTMLLLRNLASGEELFIPSVKDFAFDSLSTALATTTLDSAVRGALTVRMLTAPKTALLLDSAQRGIYTHPVWHQTNGLLAYCAASVSTTNIVSAASLKLWNTATSGNSPQTLVSSENAPTSWTLPSKNTLVWMQDGKRLLVGLKPNEIHQAVSLPEIDASADTLETDLYDPAKIRKTTEIDVWKWDDDYTNIHQKKRWETVKDQTYQALYDIPTQKTVLLAARDMPLLTLPVSPSAPIALGRLDAPHRKKITWQGFYTDLYTVNIATAERKRVAEQVQYNSYLSPNGQFVLYYRDKHWFLYDVATAGTRNVTQNLSVGFWEYDDDHPAEKPPYGFAGWVVDGTNDAAFMLYDKFDVWQIATSAKPSAGNSASASDAVNLTGGEGRKQGFVLRAEELDSTKKFFRNGDYMLLWGHHNDKKYSAYFAASVGKIGVRKLLENTAARFESPVKAQSASTLIFRQGAFNRFPDLWLTDSVFATPKKITDLQKQVEQIAWGNAELVEWQSADGKPLQGILIKPANYEKGKRYPTLVYYYEILSDGLYNFGRPRFSSAISPSYFSSNGYAVFIPDVRYDDGLPGASSLKCIVPGVQKIVDMGVADPKAIGVQGHSWGGYQSMYMITQTNLFKAAVAGAPVANMTSAYGGIRYGSGLARMFQYERSQSRIGATLWERRDLYVDNSPLFFADRITTPTLIMFGDEDDAVPFTQGIEMYLAMRRLGKEAYLLQYRKEPHNPRKYANRYDYAIKMKEFFDYHLKGAPPTEWIQSGLPYRGR